MSSPHDLSPSEGAPADPDRKSRVEEYLDHLCAPLIGMMRFTERRELRNEVENHLLALIDEYEEMGLRPDVAAEGALREHGEPWAIGEALLDEWVRRAPTGRLTRRAAAGALRALAWFGLASIPILLRVQVYALLMSRNERVGALSSLVLLAVLAPFAAGVLTGI